MLLKIKEKEKSYAQKEEEIRKMQERLEQMKLQVRKYDRHSPSVIIKEVASLTIVYLKKFIRAREETGEDAGAWQGQGRRGSQGWR
jgi:hypothetical protein